VVVEEPAPLPEPPTPIVEVRAERATPGPFGVSVQSRIDGRLRGAAAAVGLVLDPAPMLELELSGLISHDAARVVPGGYAGLRLRAGDRFRPFVGGGVPVIWSGEAARVAVRGSAGLEVAATTHLIVLVDLGVEHFFNPQSSYDATLFVPIVGLQGRL
jgi:hypothetical protein